MDLFMLFQGACGSVAHIGTMIRCLDTAECPRWTLSVSEATQVNHYIAGVVEGLSFVASLENQRVSRYTDTEYQLDRDGIKVWRY